jgi:hypothetical protein
MPCHAMHPIQDLFWESFSYELQFDMHSYLHKTFILAKSGCYSYVGDGLRLDPLGEVLYCHNGEGIVSLC